MFRKTINFKGRNIVFAALALVLLTIGCQKDDICPESTATTPLIKVLFLDAENLDQDDAKSVVNLTVKAINVVGLEDTLIKRSTTSQIEIPLNTNANVTDYELTEYARVLGDTTTNIENPPNTDLINITYNRNQQYLNRACGYRILYENLQVKISKPEGDTSENWIQKITVKDSILENETTTYISIYH